MGESTRTSKAPPPPRAAAIAGLVFSLLMIVSIAIIRLAFPGVPDAEHLDAPGHAQAIALALHLVPFAGVAFLWFLGVLRNRIGAAEDQFLATVFLGSGLLFVASLFASAAVAGAIVGSEKARAILPVRSEVYYFAWQMGHSFLNIFGFKMAGVFIISTSTIAVRTAILPRWIAFSGYACGLALLLIISNWMWIAMLFPLWTTLVSVYVLVAKRGWEG